MPISNLSKSVSPLAYPGVTIPDYTSGNRTYEDLGSKDTFLSRSGIFGWGSTYYDKGFNPYRSQVDQRYYNQSAITWLGNSLANVGLKTVAVGPLSMLASASSFNVSPIAAFSDSLSQQDIYDKNPLRQLADAIDTQVNSLTYLPTKEDFSSLSFVQSLARPTELVSQNIDSVAFLAQSFMGAGALGRLNVGQRLANRLTKFSPLYQELTSLKAPNLVKTGNTINAILTNTILSTNEAALEAKDGSEQLKERLYNERLQGLNNFTDEEIKEKGEKAAFNIFWQNAATAAITNIPFVNLTKSFFGPRAISTRANEYGFKLVGDKLKGTEYKGVFEKFLFDKGYAPGVLTKSILTQAFSEGVEESLQTSIQNVNQLDNVQDDFISSSSRYLKDIASLEFLNLSDKERGKAFGLGALIGGISPIVAAALGKGPVKEARNFAKQRDEFLTQLNNSYSTLFQNSLAFREDDVQHKLSRSTEGEETKYFLDDAEISKEEFDTLGKEHSIPEGGTFVTKGELKVDDNGNPVLNINKLNKLASDAVVFDELSDLISQETLRSNPNQTKLKLLRRETIGKAAYNYLQAGAYDIFLDRLEALKESDEAQLLELGIEDPTTAKEELESLYTFAEELENLYLTTQNSTPIISTSLKDLEINERRKEFLFNKGQRLITLDSLIQNLRDERAKVGQTFSPEFYELAQKLGNVKLSEETTTLLNNVDINTLSKEELLSIEEFKDAEEIASNPEGRKYVDLAIKERLLTDNRRELGKIFDKVLDPRSGFKYYQEGDLTTSTKDVTLSFDAPVSASLYNKYEIRKVKSKEIDQKFSVAETQFYSEYISEFLRNFKPKDEVEGAIALRQVVERLLQKTPHLDDDAARSIAQRVIETANNFKELEDVLRQQADELSVDFETGDVIFEEDVEAQSKLREEIQNLNTLRSALGIVLDDATPNRLLSLTRPIEVQNSKDLAVQVAYDLLSNSQKIVTDSEYDGNTIKETYTNLAAIDVEIKKLEALREAFKSKPYLPSSALEGLLKALKEIKVLVETNLLNREAQAKRQNEIYAQATIDTLLPLAPKELQDRVQSIATSDVVGASMVLLDELEDVDTSSIAKEIIDTLSSITYPDTMFGKIKESVIKNVINSPLRGFRNFLNALNTRVANEGIKNFLIDFDIVKLFDNLEYDQKDKLLKAYSQILGLRALELQRKSPLTQQRIQQGLQTFVANAKANGGVAPSSAQERVIGELAMFLSGKKQNTNGRVQQFQNVAALKAPPGAGKSVVVTPAVFQLMGYDPSNILTGANEAPAASVIKESTKSLYPPHTHAELRERLNKNDVPAAVQVIVLDEAASMKSSDFYALVGAFTKFLNENQDRNVKLVVLYDPNQVNQSAWGVPLIESETYATPLGYAEADATRKKLMEEGQTPTQGSELPWIQNITDITPLSSTYRSDVGEIVDLIDSFTTNEEVKSFTTASTSNPLQDTKEILGTFSEITSENLIKILKSSIISNPSRTRAVVVGTKEKQAAYRKDLSDAGIDALVYTVEESSGVSLDEVYVDVSISDAKRFSNTLLFNQYMRTAISRARQFAYVSHYPTLHSVDDTIPQKVNKNKELNKARYDESLQEKAERLKLFSSPTTEAPITPGPAEGVKLEEATKEEVQVAPPLEVDVTETVVEESTPTTQASTDAYTDFEPQSEAFDEIGPYNPIKDNDRVLVIKQVTGDKSRLVIVQPLTNNTVRLVGVVSDKQLKGFTERFNIPSLEGVTLTPARLLDTSARNIFTASSLASSVELKIAENSHDIVYHYDNKTTADFKEVGVPDLLARWASSMGNINTDELVANWENYVQFRIFRSAKDLIEVFPSISNPDSLLHKPLMVISGVKSSSGRIIKPQFIELRPTVLSSKSEAAKQIGLNHIYEFMSTLQEFTKLVKSQKWPSPIYSTMELGMSIKLSANDIYYPFHKFVKALTEKGIVASNALKDRLKAKSPDLVLEDINVSTLNPRLVELAKKLIELQEGEAQKAFNHLAATNLLVTLPNGTTKIIRDYTTNVVSQTKGKVTESYDVIGGLSLLGPLTFEHNNGRSYNALIKEPLLESLRKYLRNSTKLPLDQALLSDKLNTRQKFVASILMQTQDPTAAVHLAPLTMGDLNGLFVDGVDKDGYFSKVSEGFGLRTPLSLFAFSPKFLKDRTSKDLSLYSFVETSFLGVTPTTIGVTEVTSAASVPTTVKERHTQMVTTEGKIREFHDLGMDVEEVIENLPGTDPSDIRKYYAALDTQATYLTKITAMSRLVKAQITRQGLTPTQRLEEIFKSSIDAKDFGEPAPRDYVRAALIALIIPKFYANSPNKVLDLARGYYLSPEERQAFDDFIKENGDNFLDANLFTLVQAANELAAKYSLGQVKKGEIHSTLQQIVMLSSEYRTKVRENTLETVEDVVLDSQADIIQTLLDAASSVDFAAYSKALETAKRLQMDTENLEVESAEELEDRVDIIRTLKNLQTSNSVERSMRKTSEVEDIGELLDEEEARKAYQKFTPKNIFQILKDLWNKKESTEEFRIVSSLFMQYRLGRNNWGLFKDNIVYVVRNKYGKVGSRVIRHEVFHKIFWNYLTPVEQLRALELARKKYGNIPQIELEERLAEDFSNYKSKTGFFRKIFNRILRFLNFSYNNMKGIEDFFESIDNGYYRSPRSSAVGVERNYPILREFGTIENFTIAKQIFFEVFNAIYNDPTKVRGYDEAVSETLDVIKAYTKGIPYDFNLNYEESVIKGALEKLITKNGKAARYFIETFFYATDVKAVVELKKKQRQDLVNEAETIKETIAFLESSLEGDNSLGARIKSLEAELFETERLLSEETFDSELQDPQSKLTSRVKQRLVNIKYEDRGRVKYAEFSKAFNTVISLVAQANTTSLEEFINSVRKRVQYIGKSITPGESGYYTTVRKATAAFMYDIIDKTSNPSISNITFFKDVNYPKEYVVISRSGAPTANVTYTKAKNDPDKQIIPRHEGQTMDDFIKGISSEYNIPYEEIAKAYYLYEDLNFLRSLIAATASLRKVNPYTARELRKNYKYKTYYSPARRSGTKAAIESQLTFEFVNYAATRNENIGLFSSSFKEAVASATSVVDKRSAVSQFVRLLGYKGIPKEASEAQIIKTHASLLRAVPAMSQKNWMFEPLDVINDEGSLVDNIIDILGTSASNIEVTSYIRGDGKRAYGWTDASFQSSLFNFLTSNDSTSFVHIKKEGNKLVSTSPIIKDNLYVNNNSNLQLLEYVDHDAIRRPIISKYLQSEGPKEYHQRHFIFGFLAALAKHKTSYIQFMPVPANRRSVQGMRVSLISLIDAPKLIAKIIQNQRHRPDIPNVVNYQNRKSQITFPGVVDNKFSPEYIQERINEALEELIPLLNTSTGNPQFDYTQIEIVANLLGVLPSDYLTENKYYDRLKSIRNSENFQEELQKLNTDRNNDVIKVLPRLLEVYYYNHIIHQYSLSQLVYGDEAFYTGKEDETKRIQIATATGDVLLVDNNFGLPQTSRVAVIEDLEPNITEELEALNAKSFRESFKETDAQGYMLPEAYEVYARTYGIESDLDVTMKPVYFGIGEDGVPRSIKYSAIILTDELVELYPDLGTLRSNMRKAKVDQAVFRSAVKMGAPLKGSASTTEEALGDGLKESGIMTIHNQFMRIQLNPAKSPDVTVSNPSQLTSFQNTNGLNTAEITDLHRLNAQIISLGSKKLSRELQLSHKGKLTGGSFRALRQRLVNSLERVRGSEDVASALSAKDENNAPAVSFNLPLIQSKVVASIASIVSSATVGFRFKGSKLVLQSAFGTLTGDDTLKYKDRDGYTEVLLPDTYRNFFQEGDVVTPGNKDGIVGFRIPSTNYHSALALKVKGFYPVPQGSMGNIIIAPKEIVFFHGSDYDIDTLFIISKSAAANKLPIKDILSKYFKNPKVENIEEGVFVGCDIDGSPLMVEGLPLHTYLEKFISILENKVRDTRKGYLAATKDDKTALALELDEMEQDLDVLLDTAIMSSKNNVVYLFSSNLRDIKNRMDLLTPISFERASSTLVDMQQDLKNLLEEYLPKLVESGVIKKNCK